MDDTLRAKLDEARVREWAGGKQRPANAEQSQFRNSLTNEDRSQIEERIEQLVRDNPTLSPTNARTLDGSGWRRGPVGGDVICWSCWID